MPKPNNATPWWKKIPLPFRLTQTRKGTYRWIPIWNPPKISVSKFTRKKRWREAARKAVNGELRRGRLFRTLRRAGLAELKK